MSASGPNSSSLSEKESEENLIELVETKEGDSNTLQLNHTDKETKSEPDLLSEPIAETLGEPIEPNEKETSAETVEEPDSSHHEERLSESTTPQREEEERAEALISEFAKQTSPVYSSGVVPEAAAMEEIASSALESLNFSETTALPSEQHGLVMQNNENETIDEKKQISQSPGTPNKTSARSGIRPPTAVLRQPKVLPSSTPRPTTAGPSASSTISTPRQISSAAPSPRPLSKMSQERSDIQKSTSTRSINNAGKFTPKVNAKFVNVRSKVGSVTNHKPGGGNVEIFSEKKQYNAQSKVGSLKNATHVAGGGNVQIESRKLDFSYASPKVGSKTNYQPARSDVKILSEKLTWEAKSKVGSLDNASHKATGGNVQILSQKLNWKAESKVGSKDNMHHRPGGGNVKIFDEKIRYVSTNSSRNHSALDISSL